MKKRIIIIGPISNYGGRDVEVNIIASALETKYDVTVFSTGYMSEDSFALQNLSSTVWNCVYKKLYKKKITLKILSFFSKVFNKGKNKNYEFVRNSFSKKLYDLDDLSLKIIYDEITKANLVLMCVQLTTKFLPEIISFCEDKKIPSLLRTTGTIRKVNENSFDFLKKVSLFIHHSESNAGNLNKQLALPYEVIDQCALNEKKLLLLTGNKNKQLRFGYLGRLSEEKGLLPVAEYFSKSNLPFVIAGDGAQKEELLKIIEGKSNCNYIGLLGNDSIEDFFNLIDVLIISSYEESGPLVGLEAMAAGKIIISTKVGAMEERLKGIRSFWFEIENINSLQLAIGEVTNLTELEQVESFNSLREKYLQSYSFKAIAQKYLKIANQFAN